MSASPPHVARSLSSLTPQLTILTSPRLSHLPLRLLHSPHPCAPYLSRQAAAVDAALPASDTALLRTSPQGSAAPSLFPHLTSSTPCGMSPSLVLPHTACVPLPIPPPPQPPLPQQVSAMALPLASLCCCRHRCRRGRRRRRRCESLTTLTHMLCHLTRACMPPSGLAQPRSPAPAPSTHAASSPIHTPSRSQVTSGCVGGTEGRAGPRAKLGIVVGACLRCKRVAKVPKCLVNFLFPTRALCDSSTCL